MKRFDETINGAARPGIGRGLLALIATLLIVGGARAQSQSPDQLVAQTTQEVQQILKQQDADFKSNPQKVLQVVEAKILPHFDFDRMTMLAVGKDWSRATAEQQKALVAAFRNLLVKTYSGALSTYKDSKIDVKPVRAAPNDDDVSVRSQVTVPGGKGPVGLDYRMHKAGGDWKVHDIAVDGVSLVTTYRSTFKTELDRNGFDGLIKLIADRTSTGAKAAG